MLDEELLSKAELKKVLRKQVKLLEDLEAMAKTEKVISAAIYQHNKILLQTLINNLDHPNKTPTLVFRNGRHEIDLI